jgi:segregation and condensation protein B
MQTPSDDQRLFGAIEAILFVAGEAIGVEDLAFALSLTLLETEALLVRMQLAMESQLRGLELFRFDDKVQLRTNKAYASEVQAALQPLSMKTLSHSVLETLSIVAYKQPITRAEIEAYKGVGADYSLRVLAERGLVTVVGRKDTLGRPSLYGTSENFLRYFGISSLKELPPLPDEPEEEEIVI